MNSTEPFDYQRYLLSKRSVEACCLNAHVWNVLLARLAALKSRPLRILELGGGVGSMALRFVEGSSLPSAHYTIVEASVESLAAARNEITPRAQGWTFDFVAANIFDFLDQHSGETWDLLIGHALLDLLDLPTALPRLLACLRLGGLFYFPINYDGLSIFQPEVDAEFERELFAAYHRSMDRRLVQGRPSGDSLTGRHLLLALPPAGSQVLAAGASDWVVIPQVASYPADEAYFLACILQTIKAALAEFPGLDQARLQRWLELRRAQLARAELIFIAHQLDVCGILPG